MQYAYSRMIKVVCDSGFPGKGYFAKTYCVLYLLVFVSSDPIIFIIM